MDTEYLQLYKKMRLPKVLLSLAVGIMISACQSDDITSMKIVLPSHFPPPVYDFKNNPITDEGFALGKKLFYDPILSKDSTISCGSCHAQVHGFADHNVAVSTGFAGRNGVRNAPSTINLIWNTSFMWDGGVNHIEVMPIGPITDPNEMAESLSNVIIKLQKHPTYPYMFRDAFGTKDITSQRILLAITQFQGSIISATSRFDQMRTGEVTFTKDEAEGFDVFNAHCASCHVPPLFTDFSFRNNGSIPKGNEEGRKRISLDSTDYGKFKVPTLRNIDLTYPYMHDGRYFNLDQVLDHYQSCHENGLTIDTHLSNGIHLTLEERRQLKVFLKTLTDAPLLRNSKFSEP